LGDASVDLLDHEAHRALDAAPRVGVLVPDLPAVHEDRILGPPQLDGHGRVVAHGQHPLRLRHSFTLLGPLWASTASSPPGARPGGLGGCAAGQMPATCERYTRASVTTLSHSSAVRSPWRSSSHSRSSR